MNQYQFEKITKEMEKQFGRIPRGMENDYNIIFFVLDGNVLKIHRQYTATNDYRLREGLLLALHVIRGHLNGEQNDLSAFENKENSLLRDAILAAVDPYSNEELMAAILAETKEEQKEKALAAEFYGLPVICILRMIESVDFWTKRGGSNGYFTMLENDIGQKVPDDGKMNFIFGISKK